jgi:hypothetical protein
MAITVEKNIGKFKFYLMSFKELGEQVVQKKSRARRILLPASASKNDQAVADCEAPSFNSLW